METLIFIKLMEAMAQETRIEILRVLVRHANECISSGDIAAQLQLPTPTLSFHLNKLVEAGLIVRQKSGRNRLYRVDIGLIYALMAFLLDNCCSQALSVRKTGKICNI